MTKDEFLLSAKTAAQECAHECGLPAGVTVAQAAVESAWGRSQLSRLANNYFGIKAHGEHPWVELPTTEVCGGTAKRVLARFTRYNSMSECFADRDRIILTCAAYEEARSVASDSLAFIKALARHWATDPQYAAKLERIYRANRLYELDKR